MRRVMWCLGAAIAAVSIFPALSAAGGEVSPLTLQKTVGISPTGCAATQGITVVPGTTVYYCYKVTNVGPVTFTMHTLEDSVLGPITLPNGGVFDLPPGEVATATASAVINVTTRNVATWMASVSEEMTTDLTVAAQQVVATAQSSAIVSIAANSAPALGEAALAFVTAGLLLFGALRLNRTRRGQD